MKTLHAMKNLQPIIKDDVFGMEIHYTDENGALNAARECNTIGIYSKEGRAMYVKNTAVEEDKGYIEYFLKDHLGNTRVRIADKNKDVKIKFDVNNPENDELMSSHHYYPFGMAWDVPKFDGNGNSLVGSGDKTKYSYNGKELVDDLDINLHDYGARYYDPAIGRFTSNDHFASIYHNLSSFSYVANNPISHIDVDGNYIDVPNNANKAQTLNDLAKIYATPEGKRIIDVLLNSDKSYEINVRNSSRSSTNYYNPFTRNVSYNAESLDADGVTTPSYILLAHELYHAYQHQTTGTAQHLANSTNNNRGVEHKAVKFGNYLRQIYSKGFRTQYSGHGRIIEDTNDKINTNLRLKEENVLLGKDTKLELRYWSVSTIEQLQVLYRNGNTNKYFEISKSKSKKRCVHCKSAEDRPKRD